MKKIERDKWKHFYVGIPLGGVLYGMAAWYWPYRHGLAFITSFTALIAICYSFELFSKITGKGHYEMADAIAGIIGGAIGIGILFFAI